MDNMSANLSGMSLDQLHDIMSQIKELMEQNEQQTKQILVQNPVLTRALIQAQSNLGMFRNPDSVPNNQEAVVAQPAVQQPNQSQFMMPAQKIPILQSAHISIMPSISSPIGSNSYQPRIPTSGITHSRLQPSMQASTHQHHSQMGGIPHSGAPQMHQQIGNSVAVGEFVSQLGGRGAPPSMSYGQIVSPPITGERQKALLQQVMNLTDDQINLLPPDQMIQMLHLRQMLRRRQ